MRLFIAEKPSMGMEIAKVLANKNNKLLEFGLLPIQQNQQAQESAQQ